MGRKILAEYQRQENHPKCVCLEIEECEQKLAELIATMNAEIAEMKTALYQ